MGTEGVMMSSNKTHDEQPIMRISILTLHPAYCKHAHPLLQAPYGQTTGLNHSRSCQ